MRVSYVIVVGNEAANRIHSMEEVSLISQHLTTKPPLTTNYLVDETFPKFKKINSFHNEIVTYSSQKDQTLGFIRWTCFTCSDYFII